MAFVNDETHGRLKKELMIDMKDGYGHDRAGR